MYRNKEDALAKQREHYQLHKADYKLRAKINNKRYREALRNYVNDLKLKTGCAKCGYNKCVAALDFHHTTDDKEKAIAHLIRDAISQKRVDNEIKKCIVICSNCHRELHYNIES